MELERNLNLEDDLPDLHCEHCEGEGFVDGYVCSHCLGAGIIVGDYDEFE